VREGKRERIRDWFGAGRSNGGTVAWNIGVLAVRVDRLDMFYYDFTSV
jgi:hypothetical protein